MHSTFGNFFGEWRFCLDWFSYCEKCFNLQVWMDGLLATKNFIRNIITEELPTD